MEHRRSWNTSFSRFQVRSAAACRAADIAALAKKMVCTVAHTHHLSHAASFTRSIFHTQLCHTHTTTYIHTHVRTYVHTDTYRYTQIHTDTYRYIQIHTDTYRYIQIHTDTYIHTYIHTYIPAVLPSRSFTTSFVFPVFPSFPVHAKTIETHYWKKLTCGVIRSFNLFSRGFCHLGPKMLQNFFLLFLFLWFS